MPNGSFGPNETVTPPEVTNVVDETKEISRDNNSNDETMAVLLDIPDKQDTKDVDKVSERPPSAQVPVKVKAKNKKQAYAQNYARVQKFDGSFHAGSTLKEGRMRNQRSSSIFISDEEILTPTPFKNEKGLKKRTESIDTLSDADDKKISQVQPIRKNDKPKDQGPSVNYSISQIHKEYQPVDQSFR